ncbi:MAG TPA: hypothetical protein VN285_06055 [Candidatus Deferrimicrobium sp.]|nr:hypothetical protein [Candidatus Deferrimicrobium sp.]
MSEQNKNNADDSNQMPPYPQRHQDEQVAEETMTNENKSKTDILGQKLQNPERPDQQQHALAMKIYKSLKWVGIVSALIVTLGTIVAGIIKIYDWVRPPVESEIQKTAVISYYVFTDTFVDIVKRVLRIEFDIHEPQVITDDLISDVAPLAQLARQIADMQNTLERNHIRLQGSRGTVADLELSFALAKVLIYETTKLKYTQVARNEIEKQLDTHETIADDKHQDRLRYNYLLRGHYYRNLALNLCSESGNQYAGAVKEIVGKALDSYRQASKYSARHNSDTGWSNPVVAAGALYEGLFLATSDSTFERAFLDSAAYFYDRAYTIVANVPWTLWVDAVLAAHYNAIEWQLWRYDTAGADSLILQCESWFDNKGSKDLTGLQRNISKSTKALRLLNDMYKKHRKADSLRMEEINDCWSQVNSMELLGAPYCSDMMLLMDHILRLQYAFCREGKIRYMYLLNGAKKDVGMMETQWKEQSASRPMIILKQMRNAIVRANSSNYPNLYH